MLTTTKHNTLVIATAAAIAIAIPFVYKEKQQKKMIDYHIFHESAGWGYDIVMNGKLIIHQDYIPVLAEKKEFATEMQAQEAARLVMLKLKNNKFPTLSKSEVEQICGDNK